MFGPTTTIPPLGVDVPHLIDGEYLLGINPPTATIKDEIALRQGPWVTPVWTEFTADVKAETGQTITTGRSSRYGSSEAATVAYNLFNSAEVPTATAPNIAGRWTPGFNAGNHLDDGCPVRRRVEYPGTDDGSGTWYSIWGVVTTNVTAGYEGAALSIAQLTCTQRLAQLSQKLKALALAEIFDDDPTALWTLSDSVGSTSAQGVGGTANETLTVTQVGSGGSLDFGMADTLGADPTAVTVFTRASANNGLTLKHANPYYSFGTAATTGQTFESTFTFTSASEIVTILRAARSFGGWTNSLRLSVESGVVKAYRAQNLITDYPYGASGLVSGVLSINALHHVALTEKVNGANVDVVLYVDGVSVDTCSYSGTDLFSFVPAATTDATFYVGGSSDLHNGRMANVAWYREALSATRIAAHSGSALTGFAGETADLRTARLCRLAGIGTQWVTATGGVFTTEIGAQPTAGKTLTELLRDVEETEQGRLTCNSVGQLSLASRSAIYSATKVLTLDPALHFNLDGKFGTDRDGLVNDLTGSRTDGLPSRTVDEQSIEDRGVFNPGDKTLVAASDEDVAAIVQWIVNTRSVPGIRVPKITMHASVLHVRGILDKVLSLAEGSLIEVALPAGAPRSVMTLIVDQIRHEFGKNDWVIELSCSERVPVFTVEDTVWGRVGADAITLNANISAVYTTPTVTSTGIPFTDTDIPFDVDIDGERCTVTAVSTYGSPQILTLTRGVSPTTACAHAAGTSVGVWSPHVIAL